MRQGVRYRFKGIWRGRRSEIKKKKCRKGTPLFLVPECVFASAFCEIRGRNSCSTAKRRRLQAKRKTFLRL